MFEQVLAPLASPSTPDSPGATRVLLAGYSAGCLAASMFPSLPSPSLEPSQFTFEYLLISYPLSVVLLLTLYRSSAFHAALSALARSGAPVLALFGDSDQFTAVDKFRAWAAAAQEGGGHDGWKAVEVEGADHFWREADKRRAMLKAVSNWLAYNAR